MVAIQSLVGKGLYTPREAARFTRVNTRSVNRWLFGSEGMRPVIDREVAEDKLVTFTNLIETLAVGDLRRNRPDLRGITIAAIRDAIEEASQRFGKPHPLARSHAIYRFGDKLLIRIGESPDQYQGTRRGDDRKQTYHKLIVEPFLEQVSFPAEGELASEWTPMESRNYRISLHPAHRFGMPTVRPVRDEIGSEASGILASALWDAAFSEGSVRAAAEQFETEDEAVSLALSYRNLIYGEESTR